MASSSSSTTSSSTSRRSRRSESPAAQEAARLSVVSPVDLDANANPTAPAVSTPDSKDGSEGDEMLNEAFTRNVSLAGAPATSPQLGAGAPATSPQLGPHKRELSMGAASEGGELSRYNSVEQMLVGCPSI